MGQCLSGLVGYFAALARGLFFGLGAVPQRIHLGQVRLGGGLAGLGQPVLDAGKAAGELGIGRALGGLGVDLQVARQIRHDEQQIAEFLEPLLLGQ